MLPADRSAEERAPLAREAPAVPDRPAGGPRSPVGKSRSRRNALQHGLTAQTLLADVLGADRLQGYHNRLAAEWQPRSPTEHFLVGELARHAAALELVEQAEQAVLRTGVRTPMPLPIDDMSTEEETRDALLAAAASTEALDRVTRYRRSHEKAFYAALLRLREMQAALPANRLPQFQAPALPFATEGDCEQYLRARRERAQGPCPHCGPGRGYWLCQRRRWQCGHCRRQVGLRCGTVLANSLLPLLVWFRAIREMLLNPACSTAELAGKLGLRRFATVRNLQRKIHAVLDAPGRTNLLAGLDQAVKAEKGALANGLLRNELGPNQQTQEVRKSSTVQEGELS
jgi:transposase-like protein